MQVVLSAELKWWTFWFLDLEPKFSFQMYVTSKYQCYLETMGEIEANSESWVALLKFKYIIRIKNP